MLFVNLALMALIAGVLVGLIGGSASLVLIPVLMAFFNQQFGPSDVVIHFATTTSLAISLMSKIFSLWIHQKNGNLNWALYRKMLPILAPGLMVGTAISYWIPTQFVTLLLAAMMVQVGYSMLPERTLLLRTYKSLSNRMSMKIGVVSGLLGVSGNELTISSLVKRGIDVKSACAMGALVSSSVSLVLVTIGMLSTTQVASMNTGSQVGYLYLPALFIMAPIAMISSKLAAKWVVKLSKEQLQMLFSIVMFVCAVRTISF
ncbi:sulfite exporter TauE/SafE family protein [Vibrio sp. S4M6]|uniref:sulfite exporter TauE/SafE family protein n=1 Tax=Vibrio sinus TaxID=2946865 RepID=UPI00202A455D|nr:sulfite exporter TauE/SafE family protein [Vibrio sinus]MCL9780144.1 sulfite exporter TauE/SafE family protein [Vibrio sinus]